MLSHVEDDDNWRVRAPQTTSFAFQMLGVQQKSERGRVGVLAVQHSSTALIAQHALIMRRARVRITCTFHCEYS